MHPRTSHFIIRTVSGLSVAGLLAVVSAARQARRRRGRRAGLRVRQRGPQRRRPAAGFQTLFASSHALAGASYKVNFVEFDSGPLVDAGFAAHRIDVGTMGDLPASLAAKAHLPVVAAAVYRPIGSYMYLLAKPGISSISQLRGKPVAYTTGTAEQAFALRALKQAGLTQKDVHQVNVSLLQLGTVLQGGAADASVVSAEQKVDYQRPIPARRSSPPSTAFSRPAMATCWPPPRRWRTRRSRPPSRTSSSG